MFQLCYNRGMATIKVRRGDTLFKLAQKHLGDGNRFRELAQLSGIRNPDKIQVGQIITLPGKGSSSSRGESRSDLIKRIYREELGRKFDPGGLAYWNSTKLSESAMRRAFVKSEEGQRYRARINVAPKKPAPPKPRATATAPKAPVPRAPKPPPVPKNIKAADLLADSQFSRFLRRMQFDESSIQSSLQAAQEAARRRINSQAGQFDIQREQSSSNIDDDFESRGLFRSGGRLAKLAESGNLISTSQRQFEDSTRGGIAEMERQAAGQIGDLRRQRAEEELDARDRLTIRSAGI